MLLERAGRHAGQLVGRSPYNQSVHVEAPAARLGSIVDVRIESAGPNSLSGRLAGPGADVPVEDRMAECGLARP